MSLLPKSIHRCRCYPTKFNSGRDIPDALDSPMAIIKATLTDLLNEHARSQAEMLRGPAGPEPRVRSHPYLVVSIKSNYLLD